jgi:uncharacterized protein YdaU (DUF1376 family)
MDDQPDGPAGKGIKLPHMPLWVYDIDTDRDCRRMPDATFGRYMRLLIRQWIEGSVPATPAEAMRDAMLDPGSEGDTQSLLDRKFSALDGSARRNGKCDEERQKAIQKILVNREAARKGGKSKRRRRSGANAKANALADAQANAPIRASDSDSVSSSEPLVLKEIPENLNSATVREAVTEWFAHRREIKKPWTPRMARSSFRQWGDAGWSESRIVAAIRHSMANGWQGIHEPKTNGAERPTGATNGNQFKGARRPIPTVL